MEESVKGTHFFRVGFCLFSKTYIHKINFFLHAIAKCPVTAMKREEGFSGFTLTIQVFFLRAPLCKGEKRPPIFHVLLKLGVGRRQDGHSGTMTTF